MTKDEAISYLQYLHELENKYRSNLFAYEIASLLEKVRLEFIVGYARK
ncbi:MAG: hypothetical protein Q9M40_01155 [Sulfurimonas sp.]|nr:hypothetical protein [Sulfurimonas sp.]